MIGNVSAVPPEARHAKRLLGLLGGGGKTPALAGRALLSAVAAVDVTLPPNPSVDGRGDGDCCGDGGGEDAAVMEAVRAALERRRGGSAAAAGPGPGPVTVPAPAEDPLRLRASSAAAATLRDGLARAVRSLVEADERARAAGEKGRERIEERLGMALVVSMSLLVSDSYGLESHSSFLFQSRLASFLIFQTRSFHFARPVRRMLSIRY